jgi:peptide chain release factor subunit 1
MPTGIMFDEKVVVKPPKPISRAIYVCDNRFHVDNVLELYKPQRLIGVLFVMGADSSFHVMDAFAPLPQLKEAVSRSARLRSHNKGGQSSARFARIHQNQVKEYLKALAEDLRLELAEHPDIEGFIIAGTTTRRKELLPYFHRDVESKMMGLVTSETLEDAIPKILTLYDEHVHRLECREIQQFTSAIDLESGLEVYGTRDVTRALLHGELVTLLVHAPSVRSLDRIERRCQESGTRLVRIEGDHSVFRAYGVAVGLRYFAA